MKQNDGLHLHTVFFLPCEWIDPAEHFHSAQWDFLGILIMRAKVVGVGWINLLHFFRYLTSLLWFSVLNDFRRFTFEQKELKFICLTLVRVHVAAIYID